MATYRTAQQLVDLTRQYVGIFDKTRLRDGFADLDEGEADFQILTHLNAYYRSLIPTGFVQCTFQQSLLVGSGVYNLDMDIGTIVGVVYFDPTVSGGYPLKNTQVSTLDGVYGQRGWRAFPAGKPQQWLMQTPRIFTITPPPLNSGAYVEIQAESPPADLVSATDVPIDLFTGYHDELAYGAASSVLNSIGDELSMAKLPFVLAKTKRLELWVQELAQSRNQVTERQIQPLSYRRRGVFGGQGLATPNGWQ